MGPIAGPICAAVVVFPTNAAPIKGVGDSKQIPPAKRVALAPTIMREATFFGIGWAHPSVIDEKGLPEAWRRACLDALEGAPDVDLLMIDGNKPLEGFAGKQRSIVKGDAKVWQIGAASIIAKVVRDLEMVGMGRHYPAYNWSRNMGYGSKEHLEALFRFGPTPYHRGLFLRKIWWRYNRQINKERPAWKKWEKEWAGDNEDFSTQEDLAY
jgi:ribonuclease HII